MHKLCLAVYMYTLSFLAQRLAVCLYDASRACVCVYLYVLSVLQVLRSQHGHAAARGGANLGLRRSSQRSLCAASLLHRDQAQSQLLQVRLYKYATPCNSIRVSVTTANFSFRYTRCVERSRFFARLVSWRQRYVRDIGKLVSWKRCRAPPAKKIEFYVIFLSKRFIFKGY